MRLVTRSDFDGLACGALLKEAGIIDSWTFAHPKDLQDGLVEITEDVIDKAKKIKDANDDIKKIDDILNDSTSFHHKADNLYEELVKNLDYSKYIMAAKIAKGMAGKIPFKQLPFLQKRNVFAMIRESISAYILNELTEKEENK